MEMCKSLGALLAKSRTLILLDDACSAALNAVDDEAMRAAARQFWDAAECVESRDRAGHAALVALGSAAWWLARGRFDYVADCLDRAARAVPAEHETREWVAVAIDTLTWRVERCRRQNLRVAGETETE